jgi:hypothetical protein
MAGRDEDFVDSIEDTGAPAAVEEAGGEGDNVADAGAGAASDSAGAPGGEPDAAEDGAGSDTTDAGIAPPAAPPRVNEQQVLDLIERVRDVFGDEITVINLVPIVGQVMEMAEALAPMAGPAKKALVVKVLTRLLDEIPHDAGGRDLAVPIVKAVLPTVVDGFIAAAKGQLSFGATVAKSKKCCRSWFPCCGKPEAGK